MISHNKLDCPVNTKNLKIDESLIQDCKIYFNTDFGVVFTAMKEITLEIIQENERQGFVVAVCAA